MTGRTADVCLALTPYAALERPSIALGILKASLQGTGITCRVLYTNFLFAELMGTKAYAQVGERIENLLGDWTFAASLFPSFTPDTDEFFQLIADRRPATPFWTGALERLRPVICEARSHADEFVDRAADEILRLHPRIVGCSSVFQQHVASLAVLQRIRQIAPDVVTIMGGANCEGRRGLATLRSFPFLDYVVSGEADLLFPDLCRMALDAKGDVPMDELPFGVLSQKSAVQLDPAEIPRAVVKDLNRIPTPDYDDYFEELRRSPIQAAITATLPVETSRGCWWGEKHRCSFCGLMSGSGIAYRSKDPERVLSEFNELVGRHGVPLIECVDNMLDHRYLKTLMPMLRREQRGYVIFYETKANLRDADLELLSSAGVRHIQPGIESLHDEALLALGKGTTAATNLQLLKWALQHGIYVTWNFLVGIPGERDDWYAEVAELVPLIAHLQPPWATLTPIQYERFSRYFENAADFGLDLVPNPAYGYVYPFEEAIRGDLAVDFEDRNDPQRNTRLYEPWQPGLRALFDATEYWRNLWLQPFDMSGGGRPELKMNDDGQCLTIIDTRPAAVEVFWELTPLESSVYRACNGAVSRTTLVHELRAFETGIGWEQIAPALEKLIAAKLMVRLGERYLALAVRQPSLPFVDVLPAGLIDKRLLEEREQQSMRVSGSADRRAATVSDSP